MLSHFQLDSSPSKDSESQSEKSSEGVLVSGRDGRSDSEPTLDWRDKTDLLLLKVFSISMYSEPGPDEDEEASWRTLLKKAKFYEYILKNCILLFQNN